MNITLLEIEDETYPLTDEEIEQHVRRDDPAADQDLFDVLKLSALEAVESYIRRPIRPTRYKITLDAFPWSPDYTTRSGIINLPFYPVIDVHSVKYVDVNGTLQTLGTTLWQKSLGGDSTPGKVAAVGSGYFPEVQLNALDAVQIEFSAGFEDYTLIPVPLKHGILLALHDAYTNRGGQITGLSAMQLPQNVESVCHPFRNRYYL